MVVVGLRLYTRVALRRAGWDDFFIALSLANALVCSSLVQVAISYGLGRHLSDIPDGNRQIQAIKYTVIAPNFSVVSTTTGKMSVTIFLLRLMGQSASAARRWFLYIMMAVSVAWNVLAIVIIIGFCRPPERIWNPKVDGSCFSLNFQLVAGTSQAAFNAFNDLALAVFPAYIFWHVQLAIKMKVAIISVMGAGILYLTPFITPREAQADLLVRRRQRWSNAFCSRTYLSILTLPVCIPRLMFHEYTD